MIDSILYGLFGDSALDQFFDLLTPSCGWSEMNEQECVMSGCCWTAGKCSKSLDPMALTSDQVTAALKYVQYKDWLKSFIIHEFEIRIDCKTINRRCTQTMVQDKDG